MLPNDSRLTSIRLVVGVLVLLLAGCGGDWSPRVMGVASTQEVLPVVDDGAIAGWDYYGGDEGGGKYSPLAQINSSNVDQLELVWSYQTSDLDPASFPDPFNSPSMQVTPILAQDTLYLCSPRNRIIALDPETGDERWHFDTDPDLRGLYSVVCRGVAYYHNVTAVSEGDCAARIIAGTLDGRLFALDATDGKPCRGFGDNGQVDLKLDVGELERASGYALTSAPTLIGDNIVVGAHVGQRAGVRSGLIRAFDAVTGALIWSWDPVLPGTSIHGTPNAWAPFAVDSARGLVYIPTGNPADDYYTGNRQGRDYYGSSVVALDGNTGKIVWHFQAVHHDVWDYDLPSQPLLFDFPGPDGPVPALAQASKMGLLFVLNRETGEPLFPIEERTVPRGGPESEALSSTQPFPLLPEALHPGRLTEDDMWGFTWFDRQACVKQYRTLKNEGRYTPVGTEPTLNYPGFMGGSSWGGVSWDPVRKLLIANTTRVPAVIQLIPRIESIGDDSAERANALPNIPYTVKRQPMLSPLGAPCNRPPWGALSAIDMRTGKKVWEVPLGTLRDLAPFPLWLELGVPNTGGALLTGGGLTFIGAASDSYLRAYRTETGEQLWKTRLPAGGNATPMTYRLRKDGRQYVVIAAGGHSYIGSRRGDYIVAYALP